MKLFLGEHEVPTGAADYSWTLATGQVITVNAPEGPLRTYAAECAQAGIPTPVRGALAHADFWVRFVDTRRLVVTRVPLARAPSEDACP